MGESRQAALKLHEELQARHQLEAMYWDKVARKYSGPRDHVDHRSATEYARKRPWLNYVIAAMGDLKGKRVLEVGCGTGEFLVLLARTGAQVTGIDVSPQSVAVAGDRLRQNGFPSERAVVMPIEKLEFPDATFDFVFGRGMLHHVVLDLAGCEVARVLVRGGVAGFVEPLGHNPILEFARHYLPYPGRLPHTDTTDCPLRLFDLEVFHKYFREVHFETFQLLSMLRVRGIFPIGRMETWLSADVALLRRWPSLRRFCRLVSLVLRA
jgi:ubiquinone/menaquinone biosynthesis C-methylase UbiE